MALSENCENRLYNWKFESAAKCLGEQQADQRERSLVTALAETFGNCGWFDGQMGVILAAAVGTLISDAGGQ